VLLEMLARNRWPARSSPAPGIGMRSGTSTCWKNALSETAGAGLRTTGFGCEARAQGVHLAYSLYSGAELTDLLAEAGFSGVQLYGSLAGTPYDQTAQRLVAVATT